LKKGYLAIAFAFKSGKGFIESPIANPEGKLK